MSIVKTEQRPLHSITRRLPQLSAWSQNRQMRHPLAAVRTMSILAAGGLAVVAVIGGAITLGAGALAAGAAATSVLWFRAKRNGLWLHALVETDEIIASLALPIPLSLIRWGLLMTSPADDAAEMARMVLETPELLDALHKDAIEIVLDSPEAHVEVVIGKRRKRWKGIQFNIIRSFSTNHSLSHQEGIHHV